jgi:hypothetical protein
MEQSNPTAGTNRHAVNIGHFFDLVNLCQNWGTRWLPAKESLRFDALRRLEQEAVSSLVTLQLDQNAFNEAVNHRRVLLKNLQQAAPLLPAFITKSRIPTNTKKLARQLVSYIKQGQHKYLAPLAGPLSPGGLKTVMAAQQYYDGLAALLHHLATTLQGLRAYKSITTHLNPDVLHREAQRLLTANLRVTDAFGQWLQAKHLRNALLYNPLQGLVATGVQVQQQARLLLGEESPEYEQCRQFVFSYAPEIDLLH